MSDGALTTIACSINESMLWFIICDTSPEIQIITWQKLPCILCRFPLTFRELILSLLFDHRLLMLLLSWRGAERGKSSSHGQSRTHGCSQVTSGSPPIKRLPTPEPKYFSHDIHTHSLQLTDRKFGLFIIIFHWTVTMRSAWQQFLPAG